MANSDTITKDDVILYLEGDLTDPREVTRIEEARDNDRRVAALFDEAMADLEPSSDVLRAITDHLIPSPVVVGAGIAKDRAFRLPSEIADAVAELIQLVKTGAKDVAADVLQKVAWNRIGGFALAGGVRVDDVLPKRDERFRFEGGKLHVRVPAAEVPFGVARVILKHRPRNQVLATFLVPVAQRGKSRVVSVATDKWTKGCLLKDIDPYMQPATEEKEILKWFSQQEVTDLLEDPAVLNDAPLRDDVQRLVDYLSKQQGG